MPTPYTMKFIIMVWLEFFARARPVSTRANPACMNMTRNPVTKVHTKLIAILFCPAWFTTSAIVRPFALGVLSVIGSARAKSDTVPVSAPSGSPLARASAFGASIPFKSVSVIGTGVAAAAAGVAAGAAGGAAAGGVCALPSEANNSAAVVSMVSLFIFAYFLQIAFLLKAGVIRPMIPNRLTARPISTMIILPFTLDVIPRLITAITKPNNVTKIPIALIVSISFLSVFALFPGFALQEEAARTGQDRKAD